MEETLMNEWLCHQYQSTFVRRKFWKRGGVWLVSPALIRPKKSPNDSAHNCIKKLSARLSLWSDKSRVMASERCSPPAAWRRRRGVAADNGLSVSGHGKPDRQKGFWIKASKASPTHIKLKKLEADVLATILLSHMPFTNNSITNFQIKSNLESKYVLEILGK